MRTTRWIDRVLFAFACVFCQLAAAQYPSKPVRIIVTNAPGVSTDILARAVASRLQVTWGQAVVIENRAGANGIIAAETVAKSEPDGYTLLVHPAGVFTFHPSLYDKLPYDVFRDFTPVSKLAATPIWIVVNASLAVKTVGELVAMLKAQPGKLSFATVGGTTGLPYIASALMQSVTGTQMQYVNYKGGNQAHIDLLSGQIQLMFDAAPGSMQHVKSGRMRALAVMSPNRTPAAPEVPTIAEAGFPEVTGEAWNGISARAGTPPEVIRKIHIDSVAALRSPEIAQKMVAVGFDIIGNTPEEFAALIRAESAKWGKVIRDNKIRAE
jgi:tripartite-type tricarboxylate transporter receptor subunit TctC